LTCERGEKKYYLYLTEVYFCFLECYNKSQGIVLLQIYDRSISQNSCARSDIILKRGSRSHSKQQTSSNHTNEKKEKEIHSLPQVPSSTAMMMMGIKQEDRNLSVCLTRKKNCFLHFLFCRNYPFLWIKDHHYFIHLVHHHFLHLILIMMHY
jgi:hypothetical protein